MKIDVPYFHQSMDSLLLCWFLVVNCEYIATPRWKAAVFFSMVVILSICNIRISKLFLYH